MKLRYFVGSPSLISLSLSLILGLGMRLGMRLRLKKEIGLRLSDKLKTGVLAEVRSRRIFEARSL